MNTNKQYVYETRKKRKGGRGVHFIIIEYWGRKKMKEAAGRGVLINTHEQNEYGSCREGRGEERGYMYSINTQSVRGRDVLY